MTTYTQGAAATTIDAELQARMAAIIAELTPGQAEDLFYNTALSLFHG